MSTVLGVCNGIRSRPGNPRGWTDLTASHFNQHTEVKTEKFEYWCTAVFRRFGQDGRAQDLADVFNAYGPEYSVHLVGHSNGADVICRSLRYLRRPVATIQLFSPACESDFQENGLADALEHDQVGSVWVYRAGRDLALRLARFTRVARIAGLGYGLLGLEGPRNAPAGRVHVVDRPDFGHSTWWQPKYFGQTMQMIAEAANIDFIPYAYATHS